MKIKYGVKIEWEKKPDNLSFRESDECPISKKKFTKNVKKLGCSKSTIAYHLGQGQKQKTRERTRGLRGKIRDYVAEYKESIGCVDCGEKYPYYMLDLDHLSDKKFGISQFHNTTTDIEIVKEEIAKCEVVCANCHRIRTYARLTKNAS